MIYSARTDFNVANTPTPPPLAGANSLAVDPDFGTQIVRATDGNTLHNASFSAGSAGGSLLWNVNSTMFWINTVGGGSLVLPFNPTTLMVGMPLVIPAGALCWSHVNPLVLYSITTKGVLVQYTLAADLSSYAMEIVFDFTTALGPVTWHSEFMVSADDSVFGVGFSTTGGQGTANYGCAYVRGRGMRYVNTLTGEVAGWGLNGTINLPDRFLMHEVSMSKLGDYIMLGKSSGTTLVGDPLGTVYFWDMLGLDVQYIGDPATQPGGHPAQGFKYWMNPIPFCGGGLRPYSNVSAWKAMIQTPPGLKPPLDGHASWHNDDDLDTQPFCQITTNVPTPPGPYTFPWVNEILLMDPVTGLVYRQGHTFASGQNPYFSAQYAVGSISQDGRFVIHASDWMGTLGTDQAGKPRADIFIRVLR